MIQAPHSTSSNEARALMAQFAHDASKAQIAGDAIKAKIARDSFRFVAWMDSTPPERLLIELFGYSAHVDDWLRYQRRRRNSHFRKGRRRHQRQRPPDGLRTPAEAAAKLGCSIKTLNGHVAAGALKYVIIGHGTKRPRKLFTDADLEEFITAQTRKDTPCPSTSPSARHSTSMTSGTKIIAFTERRNARRNVKRKQ